MIKAFSTTSNVYIDIPLTKGLTDHLLFVVVLYWSHPIAIAVPTLVKLPGPD